MEVRNKGFSLIEIVLGLTMMAIVVSGIVSIIFTYSINTVNPIFDIKSDLLARRIFNEMTHVSYDENSDHNGGYCRCGENYKFNGIVICPTNECTEEANFGLDQGEKTTATYKAFNDVDDFITEKICIQTENSNVKKLCSNNQKICASNNNCMLGAPFFIDESMEFSKFVREDEGSIKGIDESTYENFFVYIDVKNQEIDGMRFKKVILKILTPRDEVIEYNFLRGNY
ncbi:MAG: hypothetical protein ACI4V7_12140 [Succinivibrionaceae bacterium]